jgi:hypothetical protein
MNPTPGELTGATTKLTRVPCPAAALSASLNDFREVRGPAESPARAASRGGRRERNGTYA